MITFIVRVLTDIPLAGAPLSRMNPDSAVHLESNIPDDELNECSDTILPSASPSMIKTYLPRTTGLILFNPTFLSFKRSTEVLSALISSLPWQCKDIKMFGKDVKEPRLTVWMGDSSASYKYSGVLLQPTPWTPLVISLKEQIEAETGARFNSVLCNYYRDGNDYMGYHSDDEKELGPNSIIASLSIGAERRFIFKAREGVKTPRNLKAGDKRSFEYKLSSGSLLVMAGATQKFWKHSIPKQRGVTGRINLTFRLINK
ncbi:hypothetical protein SmJEL517_g02416 [Synchytrium microbalum]|uniref:DNA oxidative demethylase ALKBH2 n=1 Tax=Synchytrium microbalum TaxID=1806994 RepID=A0A507C0S3_9FUNG|nr:uncharacterized protein SmJEL517_g02416 [Synchytrium microbalum]TPX35130.1 hypothetical protein SmJEL517_g02416 [Synchytrium microbalum]